MTPDAGDTAGLRSKIPVVGAYIDYLYTSVKYLVRRTLVQAGRVTLSPFLLTLVTLLLGLVSNVKFVTWTLYDEPLHSYLNVIGIRLEESDCVLILMNCLLIWKIDTIYCIESTSYFCMPLLVASFRGMLDQVPTAYAILHTTADANGKFRLPLFNKFSSLFLIEVILWLILYLLFWLREERLRFLLQLYYRGPQAIVRAGELTNDELEN